MPPSYSRLSTIAQSNDLAETVHQVNLVIAEINNIFSEIEVAESITRGTGGQLPKFFADVDLNNNRVRGVERSREPQDVVTRRELEEIGLLTRGSDQLEILVGVNFNGIVTSSGPSGGGGSSFATVSDVVALIDAAIGANVAVSQDGLVLSIEDAAGRNGTSQGSPIIARDSLTGKARLLQSYEGRLAVESPTIAGLLEILIKSVEELKNELRNRG